MSGFSDWSSVIALQISVRCSNGVSFSSCIQVVSFSELNFLAQMAVADDATNREFLQKNVTSDLQYIWDDSEIGLDLQYRMAQHYKSLRVFIAIAENTADVRTAMRTDFQLDSATGAAERAEVARVVSA